MPLPFDSRNENIFQRLGAWAILVTSGHAYRYDIVKSRGPQKSTRGPQKSTGSPEVERVRQDSHFDRKSITSDNWKGKLVQKHVAWGKIIFSARIKNILSKLTYSDGSVPIDNHRYNIRWPKMVIWGGDRAKSFGWKYYHLISDRIDSIIAIDEVSYLFSKWLRTLFTSPRGSLFHFVFPRACALGTW